MKSRNIPPFLLLAALFSVIYFPVTVCAIEGDITGDGAVDLNDVNALSANWLRNDCAAVNSWCGGADIDESNSVDFVDFALLANNWLKIVDAYPPITGWYDGEIHFHTNTSPDDGGATLATMISSYRDTGGFSFACVSGHNYIFDANQYTTSSFLGINGFEASQGPHVVGFDISGLGAVDAGATLQAEIDYINSHGGLPMVAHPHWSQDNQSYDMPTLLNNMTNCNLINVYNRRCERLDLNGNSETYWDTLLTNGKIIYGYAEDDAHGTGGDMGYSFNMVGATENSVAALRTAFQNGNFYFCRRVAKWGAGITITQYQVWGTEAGDTINITTNGGQTIQFIGHNGTVLSTVSGNSALYTIDGTEQYVRIRATNSIGDITWTQPVFVTP